MNLATAMIIQDLLFIKKQNKLFLKLIHIPDGFSFRTIPLYLQDSPHPILSHRVDTSRASFPDSYYYNSHLGKTPPPLHTSPRPEVSMLLLTLMHKKWKSENIGEPPEEVRVVAISSI